MKLRWAGLAMIMVAASLPAQVIKQVAITVTPTSIHVGDTAHVTSKVTLANGKPASRLVQLATANPDVAIITSGVLIGTGVGTTTVLGQTLNGGPGNAPVGGTAQVTVVGFVPPIKPVATVTVSVPPALSVGGSTQATAIARDSSGDVLTGRTMTWGSSAPSIASVSMTGLVSGLSPGSASVSATSEGKTGAASVTVAPIVVLPAPVARVTVTLGASTIPVPGSTSATATAYDSAGTVLTGRATNWQTSSPGVATVSASGLVTAVAVGTASISAFIEGKAGAAPLTVVVPTPPSPGHPHEPPNFSMLSPTLTGNDLPFPESTGETPPIGWVGRGLTVVRDTTFPGGPQNTLQTYFPPACCNGTGPSAAWTYQRNVNPQNWVSAPAPRHTKAIYISWWHEFVGNFGISLFANKMLYPESWKPADGGNTNVQAGVLACASSDSIDDTGGAHGGIYTNFTAPIYPCVGLQGPVIVDGVDYSVQGGVGLQGWKSPHSSMLTISRGQWHHWEVLIELNQPGVQNGTVRVWIDGQITVDFVQRIRWLIAENEEWSWLNYNTVYNGPYPNDGIGGYHRIRDMYVSGCAVDGCRVSYGTSARVAPVPKGTGTFPLPKGYVPDMVQTRKP